MPNYSNDQAKVFFMPNNSDSSAAKPISKETIKNILEATTWALAKADQKGRQFDGTVVLKGDYYVDVKAVDKDVAALCKKRKATIDAQASTGDKLVINTFRKNIVTLKISGGGRCATTNYVDIDDSDSEEDSVDSVFRDARNSKMTQECHGVMGAVKKPMPTTVKIEGAAKKPRPMTVKTEGAARKKHKSTTVKTEAKGAF